MARLPGKKIDTWEWSKDKQVFKVDVRMATDRHRGGMQFGVVVPDLDINIWNKDIDELRKLVFAELNQKVNIDWQPYLYIQVSGDTAILKLNPKRDQNDDDEPDYDKVDKLTLQEVREQSQKSRTAELTLRVTIESWELATSPTGQKLSREIQEYRSSSYAREDWPDVGMAERESRYSIDTEIRVSALVLDTPTNREAINSLSRELQRLIDRLVEICSPQTIERTLAAAIGTRLLTAGSDPPQVKREKGRKKR